MGTESVFNISWQECLLFVRAQLEHGFQRVHHELEKQVRPVKITNNWWC